ncbi:hypothetical protein C900_05539 [Fulvivirga imtechensis AK7]|uniref:Uncharacterized protein n=1 Tax=Fulvivirga imtechensis AK7 TaxID=1237149 RepID=L8JJ98_9BACT|nr:hypothetical protein [Fulvivirga imtechensis]ELR68981.1 hypothetical protein C900_05539 [Fulvivirga imtechensis AK7]
MNKYQITVRKSSVGSAGGWIATVAKQYAPKGAKSSVALGESEIYATKQEAWTSIQKRVEKLDFEGNEVHFNSEKINSYEEVQQKVEAL